MEESLRERLYHILARNCLWINFIDEHPDSIDIVSKGPLNIFVASTSIILQVKRNYKGFRKNQLIKISERQIEEAIKEMKIDSQFRRRCEDCSITVKDVEELINRATYGTLSLDLFDY